MFGAEFKSIFVYAFFGLENKFSGVCSSTNFPWFKTPILFAIVETTAKSWVIKR